MSDCSPDQKSNSAIPELDEAQQRYLKKQRQKKFEDKARKQGFLLTLASGAASRAGVIRESKFPIIITDFMTPQKVQDLVGLPSLPETKWTITTGFASQELDNPERLQYCIVSGWDQLTRVEKGSTGEVRIWVEGKKRIAWRGYSEAQRAEKVNVSGNGGCH